MRKSILLFFSTIISTISTTALAADKPHVIIYATRSPKQISQIASSVTVIDSAEISRKNKTTVSELLRDAGGLTVANNGGSGQTTRIFMRGTNSNHVLVVMDGVRLNDPSDPGDALDFSNLTTDNIERIEILRGPQSTLYGSQALGGVINIITKKGSGEMKSNAFAEVGRYNTGRAGGGVSGEIGRTSYSLASSVYHSKGISAFDRHFGGREKDGSDIFTLSANFASKLTEQFTAKFNSRYNRNKTEFDSPGGFTRPADDRDPENDSRQLNLRASGEWISEDGEWKQEFGVSTLHLDRGQITEYFDSIGTPFFGRQTQLGRRDSFDWLHHFKLFADNAATIGFEIWSDHFKTQSLREVNVDTKALFIDTPIKLLDNLLLGLSGRLDDHQAFGRQWTWKIAPIYTIPTSDTRLKFSAGKGFKAPSLSQLYDTGYGNAALKSEDSLGYDFGFEQPFFSDRLTISATAFRNDITNLIGFDNSPPFAAINIGKARSEGIESTVEFKVTPELSFSASHTFTLTEDRTKNNQLARRPKHQAKFASFYEASEQLSFDAAMRYSGVRKDIDFASPFGRVDVKPAAVFDLAANYKLNNQATAYAKIDNLLDKRYEEVYGNGQPGRGLYLGVKYSH